MKTKRERWECQQRGCHQQATVLIYAWIGDGKWDKKGYGLCTLHWSTGKGDNKSLAELVATKRAKFKIDITQENQVKRLQQG